MGRVEEPKSQQKRINFEVRVEWGKSHPKTSFKIFLANSIVALGMHVLSKKYKQVACMFMNDVSPLIVGETVVP